MNKILRGSLISLLFVSTSMVAMAQQVNTLYFMSNVEERGTYNPAFQPSNGFWIDIPVLPNFRTHLGNNTLTFEDIVFKQQINGVDSTISFLHPMADRDAFYDKLKKNTRFEYGFTFNLINFGFRFAKKNYLTFGINQKIETSTTLPRDLFRLALFGTDINQGSSFNFSDLGIDASVYTEFSVGYSRKVNDRLTFGGKLKYLMGQANFSTDIDRFYLIAGTDAWGLSGSKGSIRVSAPSTNIPIESDGKVDIDNIKFDDNFKWYDLAFTSNWGLGLDLGVTYQAIPHLQLSAAITDLGFIRWRENTTISHIDADYTFNGLTDLKIDEKIGNRWDDIKDTLKSAISNDANHHHYSTRLTSRLNLGAEYSIWKDRMGFGLLSSTLFAPSCTLTGLTASANFRPINQFSATLSYSIDDGWVHSLGMGLQARILPWSNMYIAVDRIPLHYTENQYIPYDTKRINVQVGVVMALGHKKKIKDDDHDGVKNKKDRCPNTPLGYLVDKYGCTVDNDSDGVADNVDRCPYTLPEARAYVDSTGCDKDTDGDGVPDYLDKCPDTPAEAIAMVDENGCDKDTDGDGIPDYLDKCPNTPAEAIAFIDSVGCDKDSDGDGVPDYLDKCPNTPAEAIAHVDSVGCDKDTDGDGVPDYLDKCPDVAGSTENNGCPIVITEAAKKAFQRAMKGIQFQTGKDVILKKSYGVLDDVVKVLKDNPDYNIEINGHTDNVGNEKSNLTLSEKRANAVKRYLEKSGIDGNRMKAQGFGDTKPIDTNSTAKGRANNRRVEFVVSGME